MDNQQEHNVPNEASAPSAPAPMAPAQPEPAPMEHKPMGDMGGGEKKGGKGLMWAVIAVVVIVAIYLFLR